MSEYTPTIGLEVHAEMKTQTKMFCNSKNDSNEKRPNVNICPVCMAHPGTLPVINKKAVEHVVRMGVAVGGTIADFTEFDRKNYFYPDIPKGYQISQYKYPIVSGGNLNGVAITRIHLEEDTASSSHEGEFSLVDYNRAGVPLMELVTEPVIHDAETAVNFAKELQLLLRYLGAGEANMEKGEMRIEANISVSKDGVRGTKVEVKNINSFRAVERAIQYEIQRQTEALEKGEIIVQETRGWDDASQKTFSQRLKESSHDYRYFPEPDLPKLSLSKIKEFSPEEVKKTLPELPWERRKRYGGEYGIKKEDANMFVSDERLGNLFDTLTKGTSEVSLIALGANYIGSDIAGLVTKLGEEGLRNISPEGFLSLLKALQEGKLSSRGAKDALADVFEHGGELSEKIKNYFQKSDSSELEAIAKKIIAENLKVVEEYKGGKVISIQFLVGQGMKESKGSANPQILREIFEKLLQ
ncbi:MAG: Asp-tRNA(Asn)/Glu-tRNA(Gln) amidotransferase subunit GatB [Patescibacteria group bacterium]